MLCALRTICILLTRSEIYFLVSCIPRTEYLPSVNSTGRSTLMGRSGGRGREGKKGRVRWGRVRRGRVRKKDVGECLQEELKREEKSGEKEGDIGYACHDCQRYLGI